jgi:hypothetical protein
MQFPLELRLQPSRILMASVLAAHLAAALALFHVPALGSVSLFGDSSVLQLMGGALAWSLVIGSLVRALRAERLKRGCCLWLEDDGLVELFTDGAEQGVLCRVRTHSAVMLDWAVWFRLVAVEPESKAPGGWVRLPSSMMLVASNVQAHDWRRLRTWLRHRADAPEVARDAPA